MPITSEFGSPASNNWNADQLRYDQALREGPTAALDHFRTLYNNRSTGPLISNRGELVLLSDVLSERFDTLLRNNVELWRASVESEFVLFLLNVIAGPDFFDHCPVSNPHTLSHFHSRSFLQTSSRHKEFAFNICRPLMQIMKTWGTQAIPTPHSTPNSETHLRVPPDLDNQLWVTLDSMWTSLWDRRSTLARVFGVGKWRPIAMAFDTMAFMFKEIRKRYTFSFAYLMIKTEHTLGCTRIPIRTLYWYRWLIALGFIFMAMNGLQRMI